MNDKPQFIASRPQRKLIYMYEDDVESMRSEVGRLREQLSHGMPAIDQLTKEREDYKSRWLGCLTPEEAVLIRAENARLRALLNDQDYIRCKADYNRGHLSHANYLESKERGLVLTHEQAKDAKP